MNLKERILKKSTLNAKSLEDSIIASNGKETSTDIYAINILSSGSLHGGVQKGVTQIAGPSRHFKSNLGLQIVSAFLKQHDDALCVFLDNEFGASLDYFKVNDIDVDKVVHIPFTIVEEMRTELSNLLDEFTEKYAELSSKHWEAILDLENLQTDRRKRKLVVKKN